EQPERDPRADRRRRRVAEHDAVLAEGGAEGRCGPDVDRNEGAKERGEPRGSVDPGSELGPFREFVRDRRGCAEAPPGVRGGFVGRDTETPGFRLEIVEVVLELGGEAGDVSGS